MIEPISDEDLWDIPRWALETRRARLRRWVFEERRAWSVDSLATTLEGLLDRETIVAVLSEDQEADVRSIQTVWRALRAAPSKVKAGE